ncbi:hypothetical protein [Bounagaea algeriensis]
MNHDEILVVGEWAASSPDIQDAAIEAAIEQWEIVGWPEGLLSYTALAGDDGSTVLHVSRWRDRTAVSGFTGDIKTQWSAGVDRAVPGVVRRGVHTYHPYGVLQLAAGETGFLALIEVETDTTKAAHSWMDAMLSHQRDEPQHGMLASTFYLSVAGQRVLHIAEWVDSPEHASLPALAQHLITEDVVTRPINVTRSTSWRTIQNTS